MAAYKGSLQAVGIGETTPEMPGASIIAAEAAAGSSSGDAACAPHDWNIECEADGDVAIERSCQLASILPTIWTRTRGAKCRRRFGSDSVPVIHTKMLRTVESTM